MSDSDKMRAEFETVARREGWSVRKSKGDPSEYWSEDTGVWWQWWQAAYQAGRKAEREAIVQTIRTVRGSLAWQSKISFAALAELIEYKPEGDDERG